MSTEDKSSDLCVICGRCGAEVPVYLRDGALRMAEHPTPDHRDIHRTICPGVDGDVAPGVAVWMVALSQRGTALEAAAEAARRKADADDDAARETYTRVGEAMLAATPDVMRALEALVRGVPRG